MATCVSLTASKSFEQQEEALERARVELGVQLFGICAELCKWLPEDSATLLRHSVCARIDLEEGSAELSDEEKEIMCQLFHDSKEMRLKQLSGGRSGAKVFVAEGQSKEGFKQAPTVVKIGKRKVLSSERINCERVQDLLGNCAPCVLDFAGRSF